MKAGKLIIFKTVAFLAAFLLFLVQPMAAKIILPSVGGSFMMWSACMVFFQTMLLAGYLHVHIVHKWVSVVRYAGFHWLLLLSPLVWAPYSYSILASPASGHNLAIGVFLTLVSAVGMPVLALSTTSLITQKWLSNSELPGRDNPYVLYSASNLGSVLGLLCYPLVLEPMLDLNVQFKLWWAGYALLVVLHVFCQPARSVQADEGGSTGSEPVPLLARLRWFLLSAAACAMLLSVTNVITMDIASVPLLWTLPLVVYLIAFVLTFKQRPWLPSAILYSFDWCIMVAVLIYLMAQLHITVPWQVLIPLHCLILFVVCLCCTGRLIQSKPQDKTGLTGFYLTIAVGGLAGTLLVSWIMPLVSVHLIEYPIALILAYGAYALASRGTKQDEVAGTGLAVSVSLIELFAWVVLLGVFMVIFPISPESILSPASANEIQVIFAVMAIPIALGLRRNAGKPLNVLLLLVTITTLSCWSEDLLGRAQNVKRIRTYYGIYRIYERGGVRFLQHGTTQHGKEYFAAHPGVPASYYHKSTPLGELMTSGRSLTNVAMIGMGTGSLAAYMSKGESIAIFELDPRSPLVAEENFSFLRLARERGVAIRYILGDGRVSIRNEPSAGLDILLVDAFSSDSIPMHLFTTGAFEDYLRVVKPDGIVILHVSNRILELTPIAYSNARAIGAEVCQRNNPKPRPPEADLSDWVIVSRNPELIRKLKTEGWIQRKYPAADLPRPWTDEYSNIFSAIFAK